MRLPPLADHTRPTEASAAAPAGFGPVVAIIGAGFSGTTVAIHLRRMLPRSCAVVLFDRSGRFARGPAYATSDVPLQLNVRAPNMSALPDDPTHFERWLAETPGQWQHEVDATPAGTFATRRVYGRYLRALLYQEMRQSGGTVRLCADDVVGIVPERTGYRVRCASGRDLEAAAVVVATGNLQAHGAQDGVVFHDPWAPCATAALRPSEPVLVVGTGLTMVDLVLKMSAGGFDGPVVALSRRGLAPQRHVAPSAATPGQPFRPTACPSMAGLLQQVRRHARTVVAQGGDWRTVIDGLRPVTAALWQAAPPAERSRFLRHLRPYWDVHRHRLAPGPADAFDRLLDRGVVRLRAGRVEAVVVQPGPHGPVAAVSIRDRGASGGADGCRELLVQRLIYATGTRTCVGSAGLMAELITSGLARTDPQGLGIETSDSLRIVDRHGRPAAAAWALGPIVRGVFWECTAVPDIRAQAVTVAAQVADQIAAASAGAARTVDVS